MRHCPKCGEGLIEGVCPGCGYGQRKAKGSGSTDPLRGTCEHFDRGQRCAEPAPYSSSTTGSGPWYCVTHFPAFKGWNIGRERTEPPAGFEALRALTKRVPTGPKKLDLEAELERDAIQREPRT
jgi:hypothetical protein